jgi:hypothetical protein
VLDLVKYIAFDNETNTSMKQSQPIPLPFSFESVLQVLLWGTTPESSPYSHKQIAEWCDSFWCQYIEIDAPMEIERLLPILTDVETQWDLFLANSFSLDELRSKSFEKTHLPVSWFHDWLEQAKDEGHRAQAY